MDDQLIHQLADPEEAAALTAHLVSFRSYPGEEGPVQRAVAGWLRDHGVPAELWETDGDRPNVVARLENGPGPTLLLNGHTDTVLAAANWSYDPWRGGRDGDRLYGLGACDMKSGVAANMLLARALHQQRDAWQGTMIFTSVPDEEAYSLGARALLAAGVTADYCVVTESFWDRPSLGSIGKVLIRMDVQGKSTHAAWPDAGINAGIEAAKVVARLDEIPVGRHDGFIGSRTILSFLCGNDQYVVTVPERAQVSINQMTVPGDTPEAIIGQLEALVARVGSPATFTFTRDEPFYPPWQTPVDHPLVGVLRRAYMAESDGREPEWGYSGFGDANLFSGEAGIPTVQIGSHGSNFHEADEWVSVASIARLVRALLRMSTELLPAKG